VTKSRSGGVFQACCERGDSVISLDPGYTLATRQSITMCIRGVLNKGGNEIALGIASRQSAMPELERASVQLNNQKNAKIALISLSHRIP